jgi:hypothetical protein
LSTTKSEELDAVCVRLNKNAQNISSDQGCSEEVHVYQDMLADAAKVDELWRAELADSKSS